MALKESRHPLFAVDLDDIWLHIAPDNIDAADRLLDRIGRVLTMLLDNPHAGRERPELGQGCAVSRSPTSRYFTGRPNSASNF
jgi:toxin ParE1/3/4